MLLEISGEITPERMKGWSQSKNNTQVWMWLMIEARSDPVEQYCIGTWNVRSMNQGKLEVVKRDGKSERRHSRNQWLKWTGMGEFNSDDHYIYNCRQESLRRNGVTIMVNKRIRNAVLRCNLKMKEWSLYISKATHSIPEYSKSMPQPVLLKKLKLNGFMKTYKTF